MEHDEDFPKFFLYLNLFVFAMLMLVLADNFLLLFLGWEGVGVCSYFLIGFWFERDSVSSAAKKAMIFNRIGDAAFLVALFRIYERTGSLQYHTVFAHLGSVGEPSLVAIGVLLFGGAVGKSAQLPLYPWLADAMEGPTPVSALIHALRWSQPASISCARHRSSTGLRTRRTSSPSSELRLRCSELPSPAPRCASFLDQDTLGRPSRLSGSHWALRFFRKSIVSVGRRREI